MKWQFLKFEWIGTGRYVAQVTLRKFRWFRKPVDLTFRGSCTAWHCLETGRRAPTHLELYLSDIWFSEAI